MEREFSIESYFDCALLYWKNVFLKQPQKSTKAAVNTSLYMNLEVIAF